MDKEHREVAAERYAMLVSHTLKGHTLEVRMVPEGTPNVDNIDFHLMDVRCTTCGWWDAWDERKGDIT